MPTENPVIALIGFGEAGRAFARGWSAGGLARLAAYDVKAARADEAGPVIAAAERLGLTCHPDPGEALAWASAAFCLVTADQAVAAAKAAAPFVRPGLLWFDGNSCSPGSKRRAAAVIEAAGGRYVDLAIMAPVAKTGHRTPTLLSGPHAEAALALAVALDMDARIAGEVVGAASAIKMMRSVMIKGLEALSAECLLAARRAGVDGAVLASLQTSDPEWDWAARGAYNLERMLVHGTRRAAEMREVAVTLRELGLPDDMAAATVLWQERLGALGVDAGADVLETRSDAILARLG